MVAAGGVAERLCVCLGRTFLFRKEPACDFQISALELRRRLGDVEGHPDGQNAFLAQLDSGARRPHNGRTFLKPNCEMVIGRECTTQEKGDIIAWLISVK